MGKQVSVDFLHKGSGILRAPAKVIGEFESTTGDNFVALILGFVYGL